MREPDVSGTWKNDKSKVVRVKKSWEITFSSCHNFVSSQPIHTISSSLDRATNHDSEYAKCKGVLGSLDSAVVFLYIQHYGVLEKIFFAGFDRHPGPPGPGNSYGTWYTYVCTFRSNFFEIAILDFLGGPSPFWILGVPYLRNPQRRSIHILQKHSPTMPQYGVQTSRSSALPVPSYSGSNISRQNFRARLQKIAPMTWSWNFLGPCVWGWSIFLFKKIKNLIRGNEEIGVLVYHVFWT